MNKHENDKEIQYHDDNIKRLDKIILAMYRKQHIEEILLKRRIAQDIKDGREELLDILWYIEMQKSQ